MVCPFERSYGLCSRFVIPFYRPKLLHRCLCMPKPALCTHTQADHAASTFQNEGEERVSRYIPVFERPALHQASLGDLLQWRKSAQELASSVGSQYVHFDGGPDSSDLLRELEWLLEDAVHGCMFPVKGLCRCNWKQLKTFVDKPSNCTVSLKVPLEELSSLWTQRVKLRKPFQYVVGCAHWRDFILCVGEGVLIPRPETEQVVDLAEQAIKAHPSLHKGLWADLGTGSGAIAIGLAHILGSEGSVVAVDISEDAVSFARHNVSRYGLERKVEVICGSWFSALQSKQGHLAGVVSNPPYIPSCDIASLQAEVGKYEPQTALDGGPHGTDDLMIICEGAASVLHSGGCLILETNGGEQAKIVAEYLKSMPFHDVHLVKDFAGITRFVMGIHA